MKHTLGKIHINDGDVIIIKSEKTLSFEVFQQFNVELKKKAKNLLLINCRDNMSIEKLPEKEMNKYGWYKK